MKKMTVVDIDLDGKKVLLRVDFNVPLNIDTGAISDDSRIKAALPTIKYLIDHRARIIICSHLGRPGGKVIEELRMAPVARYLSSLLDLPVIQAPDCIGDEVQKMANTLGEGEVLMLENLRFHAEEEANDIFFAQKLALLADIYVNDAFGSAHRTHASTVGVTKYLPSVAGFLMESEIEALSKVVNRPDKPFACLIGGAKVSDKIGLAQNMLKKVDMLFIMGGMAATFFKAEGHNVGLSSIEEDKLDIARELLKEARENHVSLILPVDVIVAREIKAGAANKEVPVNSIPDDSYIVDIGSKTIKMFTKEIRKCRTIMWNGPAGIYEIPEFSKGTRMIATLLSELDATTVVGGGSSAEVIQEMGLTDKITHVSTGGGASLRFMEGVSLPGVKALQDK